MTVPEALKISSEIISVGKISEGTYHPEGDKSLVYKMRSGYFIFTADVLK